MSFRLSHERCISHLTLHPYVYVHPHESHYARMPQHYSRLRALRDSEAVILGL